MGGSGCPCPLCSSCTLPRATGGARQRKAIPGEEVGRPPVVTAPWNSPIRAPRETGLHPRCREGVAGAPGPGIPRELGRSPGLTFPRSRARTSQAALVLVWKHEITKTRGCWVQGTGGKESEAGRESGSAPAGVGREQPKPGAPPLLILPSAPPTLERSPPPRYPPPQRQSNPCSSSKGRSGTWLDPDCSCRTPPLAVWLSHPSLPSPHFSLSSCLPASLSVSLHLCLSLSFSASISPCHSIRLSVSSRLCCLSPCLFLTISFPSLPVSLSPYPICLSLGLSVSMPTPPPLDDSFYNLSPA